MYEFRPVYNKSSDKKKLNHREGEVPGTSRYFSLGIMDSVKEIWRSFRKENAVFIIICIYLIFEYNRPQVVYPIIDIIPWAKSLLLVGALLAFMDKTCKAPPMSAVWPMALFSISVLVSMIFAYSPSVAAEKWVDFFGWVFVVFLLTSVINTKRRLFLFICVYFLVNLKMSQHGFRSWAMNGFGFSGWGVSGSPGWFQNSGEFSMQMAVFLPIVLAYIAEFRLDWSKSVRFFFYLVVIMSVGSIIASGSRGGVLGLAMVGIWALMYSRRRITAFILVLIGAGIIYHVMPSEFIARFETAGEDATSVSRLMYWDYGMEAIKERPWTGIGFKNWTTWVVDTKPELVGLIGGVGRVEVIHNTYLEAGTELGLLGFGAYVFVLLKIFITNFKSVQIARFIDDRFFLATLNGLFGSVLVYIVSSYFVSVLYYPYIWIIYFFSICINIVLSVQRDILWVK